MGEQDFLTKGEAEKLYITKKELENLEKTFVKKERFEEIKNNMIKEKEGEN